MDEDYYNNLIVKFFIDELNSKERQELLEWITLNKENHELFKSYEKIFDQSALYTREYDTKIAFEKIEEKIAQKQTHLPQSAKRKRFAILLFIIPLFILFPYYLNRTAFNEPFQSSKLEMRQYVNPNGKKAVIILPDSSKVTLNGGSSIYFPKQFSAHKRQVILQGEGFFEVTKDPEKPFEVLAKGTITRVLGTSFNVKAYEDDAELTVAVLTGKVRVETNNILQSTKTVLSELVANQSMVYTLKDSHIMLGNNVESMTAWLKNRLVFNNATLEEIVKELERTYNIEGVFEAEQLKHKRYSANFNSLPSLEELMQTLSASDNFHYTIQNRNKIIFQK